MLGKQFSGTGADQSRIVVAYNGTTKVATINNRNWDVTPDATSGYVMLPTQLADLSSILEDTTDIKAKTDNLPSAIAKNVQLDNLSFFMRNASTGEGVTSLTITAKVKKDGGALVTADQNSNITEIGLGWYNIPYLTASEMNGDQVDFTASATGAAPATISMFPK